MEAAVAPREGVRSAPVGRPPRLLRVASDERLVALVRAGDERAFEAVYDRYSRHILSFCRHMLGSREEAEDALQHTFLSAYRALGDSEQAVALRPWLYAIARNRCLSMLRSRREEDPIVEHAEPSVVGLAHEVEQREDLRALLRDLRDLPDDQRAALVLAEIGDLSHDEIAQVIGVPTKKVKALVFQARESLIASRKARDIPCQEIREELSTLRGGALRRTHLRRHLHECPGCRGFREEVRRQRAGMAMLLPVVPGFGLREATLGGIAGSASATGGAAALIKGGTAAKIAIGVLAVGGAVTGGVVGVKELAKSPPAPAAKQQAASPAKRHPAPAVAAASGHPAPATSAARTTTTAAAAAPKKRHKHHHKHKPKVVAATPAPAPAAVAPPVAAPPKKQDKVNGHDNGRHIGAGNGKKFGHSKHGGTSIPKAPKAPKPIKAHKAPKPKEPHVAPSGGSAAPPASSNGNGKGNANGHGKNADGSDG
jgi:RNA polymerase sigma factor (sigma-70 family)